MSPPKPSGYHGSSYLVTREGQSHHLSREIKGVGPVDGPRPVAWAALPPRHGLTLALTVVEGGQNDGGSDDHRVIRLVGSAVCVAVFKRVLKEKLKRE